MNNLFYNLYIAFKVFNNKGLAEYLHVDKHKLDVWKDRIDTRPPGDFYNAILIACKENNILVDDIFSENIIDTWMKRAREEGRTQAFREIAIEYKGVGDSLPAGTHGPLLKEAEGKGRTEAKASIVKKQKL